MQIDHPNTPILGIPPNASPLAFSAVDQPTIAGPIVNVAALPIEAQNQASGNGAHLGMTRDSANVGINTFDSATADVNADEARTTAGRQLREPT